MFKSHHVIPPGCCIWRKIGVESKALKELEGLPRQTCGKKT